MIPWPIALLTLFYGIIAAASAASAWHIAHGVVARPLWPQLLWLAASAGAACGLALLRPWGRRLAIWTSLGLMAVMLSLALLLVLKEGKVGAGLLMAIGSGLQMLAIRYLRRPAVNAWFSGSSVAPSVPVHGRA